MSGYELAREFAHSIGFFWRTDHQQIYRELARLRDRSWVEGTSVAQDGKPDKIVYSLTKVGREAVRDWSRRPTAAPTIKDDLLVRFYALDCVDAQALRFDLETRRDHHAARLSKFETLYESRFADKELDRRQTGRLLGLQMGLRYERAVVGWCDEALASLAALDGNPAATVTAAGRKIA